MRAVVLAAALTLAAPDALANGRFPRAQRLVEDRANSNHLALAATYGILTTSDRGANWHHVCEASFAGSSTYAGDPLLDILEDGRFLVGVEATLNESADACQWKATLGGGTSSVVDYTQVHSSPPAIVALVATSRDAATDFALWKSIDGAATWTEMGQVPLDRALTLDVDPLNMNRIYVTGTIGEEGQLLRSDDGGRSWSVHAIPRTSSFEAPYLAALHPSDGSRIYVRTDSWNDVNGVQVANDALLYSNDAGETWTELFRNHAKMLGFALSPDGSTVLVGYGDPFVGGATSLTGPFGIFKSATDAPSFELVFPAHVGCLAWTPLGVYVCASQHFDGFELGFAPHGDFSPDAGCVAPLLRLADVRGPLACPAGTGGVACEINWQAVCGVLGACTDAGSRGGPCAGGGASGVDGGLDGGVSVDGGGSPPGATPRETSGCDCAHVRRKGSALPPAVLFAIAAAMGLRRGRKTRGL